MITCFQEMEETETILRRMYPNLAIPNIPPQPLRTSRGLFEPPQNPGRLPFKQGGYNHRPMVKPLGNRQTDYLLSGLGLPHIWTVPLSESPPVGQVVESIGKRKHEERETISESEYSSEGHKNVVDNENEKKEQEEGGEEEGLLKQAVRPPPVPHVPPTASSYGGWYSPLPAASLDSGDPNSIDI